MGLDHYYQALPPDCELLRRSRFEPEFGSHLSLFRYYSERILLEIERAGDEGTKFEFLTEILSLKTNYPGIENRSLDFGRRWDMLCFMLSAARRGETGGEPDWAFRAIHGGEILHPEVQSGIGVAIMYLSPEETCSIWERLTNLDTDEIDELWDQERMREVGVYKHNQMHQEDWLEDFERFTEFYREAAAHDEGVIVICS